MKGALAAYNGNPGDLIIFPVISRESKGRGEEVSWLTMCNSYALFDHCTVTYLERVNARPKDGGSSAFKFGSVYGGLYAMTTGWYDREPKLVTPQMWKKAMGIGKDKRESVEKAVELFPDSAYMFYGPRGGLIDGNAEAALIAYYGYSMEELE